MKAVIQRVSSASVTIDNIISAEIQSGLLVFVGIEAADSQEDIQWLSGKIANLRIFGDESEVMNKSVKDIDGEILKQIAIELGKPIQSGIFGADMKVSLLNDGPVTILMDTKNKQ